MPFYVLHGDADPQQEGAIFGGYLGHSISVHPSLRRSCAHLLQKGSFN